MIRREKSGGKETNYFGFSKSCSIFPSIRVWRAVAGILTKVNARKEIRDAILVRRMRYWLDIALCPLLDTQVPPWKARKNFWALQKKHSALAAAHGLRATSVF